MGGLIIKKAKFVCLAVVHKRSRKDCKYKNVEAPVVCDVMCIWLFEVSDDSHQFNYLRSTSPHHQHQFFLQMILVGNRENLTISLLFAQILLSYLENTGNHGEGPRRIGIDWPK